jgi:hypothetical protein
LEVEMKLKTFLGVLALAMVAGVAPSWAVAANTLAVDATAALNSTSFGLDVGMDSAASNAVYVESDHPLNETHMTVIWRMKISALPTTPLTGGGRNVRFMTWHDGDGGASRKVFFIQRQANGNWRAAIWSWNTTSSAFEFAGGFFLAANGSTNDIHLKCEWTQATTGATGLMTCTKAIGTTAFGSPILSTTNLTDDGTLIGSVRLGFLDFDGYPLSGTGNLYLDEYESYR